MPKRLRWSKAALGEWHGYLLGDDKAHWPVTTPVAVAARGGSHLDDYPWDWYFTDHGVAHVPDRPLPCILGEKCNHDPKHHRRRHAGVTDTLRAAKSAVEWNLALAGDDENAPAALAPVEQGDEVMPNALA